jgi:serine/threonine protein kinase
MSQVPEHSTACDAAEPRFSTHETADNPTEIYEFVRRLGAGTYGQVFHAIDKRTNADVAIKILPLSRQNEAEIITYEREVNVLQAGSSCPFIVNLIETYMFDAEVWIVMEYCEAGSLESCLYDARGNLQPMTEAEAGSIVKMLLLGLLHLHHRRKIHRDVKGANVLVSRKGECKLADFGLSALLDSTLANANSLCGTPFFVAPEVCKRRPYNFKVDVWSLGVLTYVLLVGQVPFQLRDMKPMEVMRVIPAAPAELWMLPGKGDNHPFFQPALEGYWRDQLKLPLRLGWSPEVSDFLHCCFQRNPAERWRVDELLMHSFITRVPRLRSRRGGALVDEIPPQTLPGQPSPYVSLPELPPEAGGGFPALFASRPSPDLTAWALYHDDRGAGGTHFFEQTAMRAVRNQAAQRRRVFSQEVRDSIRNKDRGAVLEVIRMDPSRVAADTRAADEAERRRLQAVGARILAAAEAYDGYAVFAPSELGPGATEEERVAELEHRQMFMVPLRLQGRRRVSARQHMGAQPASPGEYKEGTPTQSFQTLKSRAQASEAPGADASYECYDGLPANDSDYQPEAEWAVIACRDPDFVAAVRADLPRLQSQAQRLRVGHAEYLETAESAAVRIREGVRARADAQATEYRSLGLGPEQMGELWPLHEPLYAEVEAEAVRDTRKRGELWGTAADVAEAAVQLSAAMARYGNIVCRLGRSMDANSILLAQQQAGENDELRMAHAALLQAEVALQVKAVAATLSFADYEGINADTFTPWLVKHRLLLYGHWVKPYCPGLYRGCDDGAPSYMRRCLNVARYSDAMRGITRQRAEISARKEQRERNLAALLERARAYVQALEAERARAARAHAIAAAAAQGLPLPADGDAGGLRYGHPDHAHAHAHAHTRAQANAHAQAQGYQQHAHAHQPPQHQHQHGFQRGEPAREYDEETEEGRARARDSADRLLADQAQRLAFLQAQQAQLVRQMEEQQERRARLTEMDANQSLHGFLRAASVDSAAHAPPAGVASVGASSAGSNGSAGPGPVRLGGSGGVAAGTASGSGSDYNGVGHSAPYSGSGGSRVPPALPPVAGHAFGSTYSIGSGAGSYTGPGAGSGSGSASASSAGTGSVSTRTSPMGSSSAYGGGAGQLPPLVVAPPVMSAPALGGDPLGSLLAARARGSSGGGNVGGNGGSNGGSGLSNDGSVNSSATSVNGGVGMTDSMCPLSGVVDPYADRRHW